MEAHGDFERGRPACWTIYWCARCGLAKFDDADMVIHSRDCGGTFEPVEVVPVEDYSKIRQALEVAVYHAENLRRVRNHIPVRDLDESTVGFAKAKRLLEALEGR